MKKQICLILFLLLTVLGFSTKGYIIVSDNPIKRSSKNYSTKLNEADSIKFINAVDYINGKYANYYDCATLRSLLYLDFKFRISIHSKIPSCLDSVILDSASYYQCLGKPKKLLLNNKYSTILDRNIFKERIINKYFGLDGNFCSNKIDNHIYFYKNKMLINTHSCSSYAIYLIELYRPNMVLVKLLYFEDVNLGG